MIFFILFFLMATGWFIFTLVHERRSLLAGASFTACLFSSALLAVAIAFHYSQFISEQRWLVLLLAVLIVIVIFCGMIWPFALIVVFFYNGIKMVLKEGTNLRNLLSLGFGVLLIAYLFIWPFFGHLSDKTIWRYTYAYLGTLALYLIAIMLMYTVTLVLNLINLRPKKLDYIVVLGAGLNGKKVSPLLGARIDRALEIYHRYPDIKLIMSGGQGADEVISEAEAMANYAYEKGVKKEDVILEDRSTTTYENIAFSRRLMKPNSRFAIATNSFHVYRALVIAKRQGLKCIGFGAKTKWYFTLNAFIREFIAYLKITYKLQLAVVVSLGVVYMLLAALKL